MMKNLLVNPVAFTVGQTEVYWYGIIMCSAIIAAILVATYYCHVKKYELDLAINIALVVVPVGILSARLFSVIFEPGLSLKDYFNFRTGGMSIIGAVIGGAIALAVYVLIKREKQPLKLFDTLAVVLILAQAIGRWGNYFNSEVYGQLITNPNFMRFPYAVQVDGNWYQALFLYESLLDLVGFGILSMMYLIPKEKFGYVTGIYLVYYGTVRTILEPLRQQEYILKLGNLPISRVFSISMIVSGIILLAVLMMKNRKKVTHEKQ